MRILSAATIAATGRPCIAVTNHRAAAPGLAVGSTPQHIGSPLIASAFAGRLFRHAHTRRAGVPTKRRDRGASTTMAADIPFGDVFFLDKFAQRQWDDPNYSGTRVSFDKADFTSKIHEYFKNSGGKLVDGYAPFCKHVFVPNFIGAELGHLAITDENVGLLRSGYSRRKPEELPVLTRWFPESLVQTKESQMLDIILYSRDQIVLEREAMADKAGDTPELPSAPWGIISVKAQDEDTENPMQPITMMRNALGKEEGGSGVPLDREKYEASVAYWDRHAPIVAGEKPSGD